jgi:hypothetical protein
MSDIKLLLDYYADENLTGKYNRNVLQIAKESGMNEIINLMKKSYLPVKKIKGV